MADINFGRAVSISFQTGSEFIAFTGGIERIKYLAQRPADEILRDLGTILCPVRFHNPCIGRIHINQETIILPEFLDFRP